MKHIRQQFQIKFRTYYNLYLLNKYLVYSVKNKHNHIQEKLLLGGVETHIHFQSIVRAENPLPGLKSDCLIVVNTGPG